jgi:4'-phosphopantetheinyl transferase EntD
MISGMSFSLHVSAELFGDVTDPVLFAEEVALVTGAASERRREFGTVRHLARTALREIGVPPAPILPDSEGAPGWPDGVVGSITHCPGYRAVMVARADAVPSIGLDAEPHEALDSATLDLVAGPAERCHLEVLAADRPDLHWGRILFSAKEAVYKAWFPITRQWLDFADVSITVDTDGSFTARLPAWGPRVPGVDLSGCVGWWRVDHGVIVTSTAICAGVRR